VNPERKGRGDKRERLLEAAAAVLAERGFVNARVADIAKRAGVGKGTVYEYFSSKDEVLLASFASLNESVAEQAEDLLARQAPAPESLLRLLDLAARIVIEHVELQAVALDCWAASRGNALEEQFRSVCLDAYRRFRRIFVDLVRSGQTRGEFRPEVDPEATAVFLVGALDGMSIQYFFDRSFDPRQLLKTTGQALLRGLAPTTS
jgi:TetR/AcrR family fatty acid metabolism transcriptional regulator